MKQITKIAAKERAKLVEVLKKLTKLASPSGSTKSVVAQERVRTIQAKYGIKDEEILGGKTASAYFYPSIQDWGWVTEEGKIESGLSYEGPTSHAQLAFRLGYKGYIGAIKAGCIRWGYSEADSTIHAEYRNTTNPERKLQRLKEYTGASKVVLENSGE